MTMGDPRLEVQAPVRRAMARVIAHAAVLVGALGALAAMPVLLPLDIGGRDAVTMVAPILLLGWVAATHARRLIRGPVTDEARAEAWDRAVAVDADDAMLVRLVRLWVPIGLLLALGVLLWPHMTDPNPALACAWVVLGMPPIAAAWLIASTTWLDASRDELARAAGESDTLFRRYWANMRH